MSPLLGVKRTCNAADVPPRPANAYTVQFVSYHKSMNEIDWNEKVKEALDRTEFMAISTIGADGSWTCPVQFGFSEKLDLYFRSMPHSKHMRHLLADNRISVAIFKTERFPGSREVMGLQLKGRAARLTDRVSVEEAARHMYGRDLRRIDYRTKVDEHLGPDAVWNFVKISPEEAWCFDSRVFGDERREIDLKTLNLKLSY
jgi:uncharacterized protein YhbP (UPF0306 family)